MEEIIFQYLCDCEELTNLITSYEGIPAIFQSKAPDDTDNGWDDESQYPRLVFDLSMQSDAERKVSGQMMIDVMCEDKAEGIQIEDIESVVKAAVDGCFFSSSDLTISAQWRNSNPFEQGDDDVIGTTLVFDVMAYPKQITTDPDPIAATNLWLKTLYQDANVIGKDELPTTWKPTNESPAIYCSLFRLGESTRMKSTYAVDWIGAELHIYVMAPSESVRATISKQIIQILTHATRIMLNDGSPMLIDKATANLAADPLRTGQVIVNATYGVLTEKSGIKLQHAYTSGMGVEREV